MDHQALTHFCNTLIPICKAAGLTVTDHEGAKITYKGVGVDVKDNISKIIDERDRLKPLLEASPHVTYIYPSDANFLLMEMKNAKGFCDFAAQNGIILRDFSNKPLTENALRISIGTKEENDKLLKLLSDFQ